MKKNHYSKISLIACVALLFAAMSAKAVDMAAATGLLADIAVAATQANSILATAADSGDLDAVAKANEVVEAVKQAMEEAMEAYKALQAGDDAALKKLEAAKQKAINALGGKPGGAAEESASESSPKEEGEGEYSFPNIYDIPWKSEGLRSLYQELFDIGMNASSQGGSDFAESDATET